MRTLNEYINESLLDDEDEVLDGVKESIIKEFLETNYKINGSYTIKETKNGFVVDVKGSVRVTNENITSFTNGLFKFGEVSEDFNCVYCSKLKSLEGAPEKVDGYFYCNYCNSLTSLKGAPQKVERSFYCSNCDSLKTLEGSPKEIGGYFYCNGCKSLTSLKGAPKKVGGSFYCKGSGVKFKKEDVEKCTKVARVIQT